jgi:hypothetical protein
MNKENARLFLPLVQALADGKTIQHKMSKNWTDIDDHVVIGFYDHPENYRIKPEPRTFKIIRSRATESIHNAREWDGKYEASHDIWKSITVQEVLK